MTKNVKFRDNRELDMGRFQIPGYTGHFPGKNAYQQVSMGTATKAALANGGYFDHDRAHSVVENNREDPNLVEFKQNYRADAADFFDFHHHAQGGKPVYRYEMQPGYTGHVPCTEDSSIGRSYRRGAVKGVLEFERVKAGIPRFRFPLAGPAGMQPIGGREMCVTGNVDRDQVPIDETVPLHVPRFMGHNHDRIMRTFYPREHCYPGFACCENTVQAPCDRRNQPVICRDSRWDKKWCPVGQLEYSQEILPRPDQPDATPVGVTIEQPIKLKVTVPMPTYQPSMAKKLHKFYVGHDKSGFSGFVPNTRNVLGSSMNREINQERQIHLQRQD